MKINFTAPCNQLGMGIVGQNLLTHFDNNDIEAAYWIIGPEEPSQKAEEKVELAKKRRETFDMNAPSIRYWHPSDLAHHVGKGKRIGYTIFESNKFSDLEIQNLKAQDLIIVPTEWARKVMKDNGFDSKVVNHGVDHSIFYTFPLREGPTCFYIGGKWEIRKGHIEACQAFNKAFEPSDNVRMIVHCHNPFLTDKEESEWINYFLSSKMGRAGKINIVGGRYRTQEEVAQLMSDVDCGVFPSRAEGWNLPLCELMSMGRHIIATDYSAHTEFLAPRNSKLLTIDKLESCFDGKWFGGRGEWAHLGEPQIDQMVIHMRCIHKDKSEGKLDLNWNGINTMLKYTWDNACQQLKLVLEN